MVVGVHLKYLRYISDYLTTEVLYEAFFNLNRNPLKLNRVSLPLCDLNLPKQGTVNKTY